MHRCQIREMFLFPLSHGEDHLLYTSGYAVTWLMSPWAAKTWFTSSLVTHMGSQWTLALTTTRSQAANIRVSPTDLLFIICQSNSTTLKRSSKVTYHIFCRFIVQIARTSLSLKISRIIRLLTDCIADRVPLTVIFRVLSIICKGLLSRSAIFHVISRTDTFCLNKNVY